MRNDRMRGKKKKKGYYKTAVLKHVFVETRNCYRKSFMLIMLCPLEKANSLVL